MNDSAQYSSFRSGWLRVGRSDDVLVNFQRHSELFVVRPDTVYYFKPLSGFFVPSLSESKKFDEIDSFIMEAFDCDDDDIITLSTDRFGGVIVMPEGVLKRAGVRLPVFREPPAPKPRHTPRLALVT